MTDTQGKGIHNSRKTSGGSQRSVNSDNCISVSSLHQVPISNLRKSIHTFSLGFPLIKPSFVLHLSVLMWCYFLCKDWRLRYLPSRVLEMAAKEMTFGAKITCEQVGKTPDQVPALLCGFRVYGENIHKCHVYMKYDYFICKNF